MTTGTMRLKNWWADDRLKIVGEVEGVTHIIYANQMCEYYDYGDNIVIECYNGDKFQLDKSDKRGY